ncbi:MarR family transcriptional regulator [Pseudomonas syringae]|uniref:MarR family transcriptional regulator n=1 Tax=Pseudomonas syringae TaxID=317 RepID=UPI0005168840|nr:helix-turn-helix domain-containing protein [Pseudomonas syringae]
MEWNEELQLQADAVDSIRDEDNEQAAMASIAARELYKNRLTEKAENGIQKLIDSNNGEPIGDVEITMSVKTAGPKKILGEFVIGFPENLMLLDIKPTELKMIFYILDAMQFGNLVKITQTAIAEKLKISTSNVNRAWKELIKKNVLVNKDGNIYLNSNFFSKGATSVLSTDKRADVINSCFANNEIKQMLNLDMYQPSKNSKK